MLPGTRALAFAARWFDPSTVARVFEPLIADWQREWQDAARFARFGVWVRGGSALLLSMIAKSPTLLLAPWPAGTLWRIITRVTVWTTVVSALMLIPFVIELARNLDVAVSVYLLILLLPSTIALAFPAAITTVVDVIRKAPEPVREERLAAVKFGLAAATLMLILVGWGFPAANQQFRVASMRAVSGAPREPVRGLRELSLVDLSRDEALKNKLWVGRESWVSSRADAIRAEIAQRTSLVVLPIVMIWMRWRALLLPRGRRYSALPLVASAPLSFGMFLVLLAQSRGVADAFFAPRWSGPWLALAVMVVSSAGIDQLRRRAAQRGNQDSPV
jgi:hypothetical protein